MKQDQTGKGHGLPERYRFSTFEDLYRRLMQDLHAIDIHSHQDYIGCRDARDYFVHQRDLIDIEFSFAQNVIRLTKNLPRRIESTDGLSILVQEKNPCLHASHCNKINVLSSFAVVQSEPIGTPEWDGTVEAIDFLQGPDISGCLDLAYANLPDVRRGIILPVPEQIEWLDPFTVSERCEELTLAHIADWEVKLKEAKGEDWEKDFYEFHREFDEMLESERYFREANAPFFQIEDSALRDVEDSALRDGSRTYVLPLSCFRLSLRGIALGQNHEMIKLGFLLPSLEQAPTHVARKLRDDYGADFRRFQHALVNLAQKFRDEPDERRFVNILQDVEHEVAKLHGAFRAIKRTHRSLNLFLGTVAVVFYVALRDPKLVDYLHAAFSGIGTFTFIEYFRHLADLKAKIEENPFYFALKLHNVFE